MFDEDQEEQKEARPIKYEDVDPFEAGWDTLIAFRNQFRYRVFFENDTSFKNGMQLDLLRDWLLDNNCGEEGKDWVIQMSDFGMEDLWNKGQPPGSPGSEERAPYGNHIYINELSFLITGKLMQDPNDPSTKDAVKYTASRITVIQTRK